MLEILGFPFDFEGMDFKFSGDLKCMLEVLGIQTASCFFNCPMGECYRIKDGKMTGKGGRYVLGPPRTLRRITECYEKWMSETGGNRDLLYKYYNCQYPPTDLFHESLFEKA